MKTTTTNRFSQIPRAMIPRSSFDRSHGHKTTFNASYLVPIFFDEALPGDTFNLRMTGFARMATPLYPLMDNLFMETFFFAVPMRLLWDNWQKFMGEQLNPDDSIDYIIPQIASPASGYVALTIHDYLGLPTQIAASFEHSALYHRAYYQIWNEWFRDQNIQLSLTVPTTDGPDLYSDYVLQKRGKRHDYFTSALPWPQKGNPVSIPLGTSAAVLTSATATVSGAQTELRWGLTFNGGVPGAGLAIGTGANAGTFAGATANAQTNAIYPNNLYADLTNATAATINQLRQAFQVQKLLERDARGGTRYVELIKAHFGVTSPDFRLQRPEYLGGGSSPVQMSSVAVTNRDTVAGVYPGQLGAYSTTVLQNHGFVKSFTEHSIILGLINVRADLTYQQGLDRQYSRRTRYDFYWPELAQIGEQTILNKEIYTTGIPSLDDAAFGYQERHAEYRYKPSRITGLFRGIHAQSLDAWHLAQEFSSLPGLNPTFISENVPMSRVKATVSEADPDFIFDSFFRLICARPMPTFGVPGFIDHF